MEFRIAGFQDYTRLAELDALYARCRGAYLPVPDVQELWDASEDGHLFVVERLGSGSKHTMVAAAGLFPVAPSRDAATDPVIGVMELAGMVVDPGELGGFGIQDIMIAIRTLAVARGEQRGRCVMASVVDANKSSMKNLLQSGLIECPTPPWLRSVTRTWCPDDQPVTNLVVPPQALHRHARLILDKRKSGELERTNKITKERDVINVNFQLNWVHDETDFLQSLANGLLLDWSSVIPKTRLVGQSPNWIEFSGAKS